MSDTTNLQNPKQYDVDTKLDKLGEINFVEFETRYSIKFSNFPTLEDHRDLRYINNEFLTGFKIPELSLNIMNNKIHGYNSLIPLAQKESTYKTSLTFKVDENLYNYFIMRDYIMILNEGNKSKEISDSEFYSQFKIDYIQVDFLSTSANPVITRTMYFYNAFVTWVQGIDINHEKVRLKFNIDIEFEREGKEVKNKV